MVESVQHNFQLHSKPKVSVGHKNCFLNHQQISNIKQTPNSKRLRTLKIKAETVYFNNLFVFITNRHILNNYITMYAQQSCHRHFHTCMYTYVSKESCIKDWWIV